MSVRVVIDANILIAEGFGKSKLFGFFLSSSKIVGIDVSIPELVVEEVVSRFADNLDQEARRVQTSVRKLSRYLNRPLSSPISDLAQEEEVASFRVNLESQLFSAGWTIINYPKVQHKEIVKRALARQRPFDAKGSGYRDTLVWKSVVDLVAADSRQLVLLASNGDFRDNDDNLHPDLGDELAGYGHCRDKVIVVTSLLKFVDTHVRPSITEILKDNPVQAFTELGIDLKETIASGVLDADTGKELYPDELDVPREYETLQLRMMPDVEDVNVATIQEVDTGQYSLSVNATLSCEFDVFVQKAFVGTLGGLSIIDSDWNDYYVFGQVTLPLNRNIVVRVDLSEVGQPRIEVYLEELTTLDDYA